MPCKAYHDESPLRSRLIDTVPCALIVFAVLFCDSDCFSSRQTSSVLITLNVHQQEMLLQIDELSHWRAKACCEA